MSATGTQRLQGKTVAVMQPYFFPYAGYFRLMHAADHFVIYDCVQFPRRGRVHRCNVPGPAGGEEWLTLPLARAPREARICDLEFVPDARRMFDRRLNRHAWFGSARGPASGLVRDYLLGPLPGVVDYLERGLRLTAQLLHLSPTITRSSRLALPPTLKGQERVLAVVRAVGGRHYVNLSGGRSLYDPRRFNEQNVTLAFLSAYDGPCRHLLPALLEQEPEAIREDVVRTTTFEA